MTETTAPETPPQEPQPGEPQPEATQAPPKRGLLLPAVVVLAAGLGAALTFPQWRDKIGLPSGAESPAPEDSLPLAQQVSVLRADLGATRERLRQLELRMSSLPGGLPSAPQAGAEDGLSGRLVALEQAVGELKARPQPSARLAEDVDQLLKQVAELKRNSADAAAVLRLADKVEQVDAQLREFNARRSSATALLLAVGQLREATEAARPYDAELRALKALAPQDGDVAKAMDAIQSHAGAGIPSRAVLAGRWEALSARIVRAEAFPERDSWWRGTVDKVLSLVVIRREDGTVAGDDAAAVVARASKALGENDLAGAVRELSTLSGPPAEVAAPWLDDAKARVEADRAVSELTAHAVALTSATGR
jgi:hypothetical protein